MLRRTDGRFSVAGDVVPRASDDLPGVRFRQPKHVPDVAVGIVESLPQDEGGTLGRRKLFQQDPYARRQRLVSLRCQLSVAPRVDQFRLP
jgi:hypothetical protein